jgi:hypothetical protein
VTDERTRERTKSAPCSIVHFTAHHHARSAALSRSVSVSAPTRCAGRRAVATATRQLTPEGHSDEE